MVKRALDWQHNASTGNQILQVESNARVVRCGSNDGTYLYSMEFWGDYSLRFPVKGPWRGTLQGAKRDLPALRKETP